MMIKRQNRNKRRNAMSAQVVHRLIKNKLAMMGFVLLLLITFASVFANFLVPYSPTKMDSSNMLAAPSLQHLFGTDALGRDILSRVLYGGRDSLALGLAATVLTSLISCFFGVIIGYAGGKTDLIGMRVIDVISSIPAMLFAIIISVTLGAGFWNTVLAMSVGGIPAGVRTARSLGLKEREMEYIEAAKASNCSTFKIMFGHMFPNFLPMMIVGFTVGVGLTIMGAAGLSFIGLGIQPPEAEWGAMLADGRAYMLLYPHTMLFPGLAILLTVLAVNLFGDGLRDAMDPKLKE